MGLNSVEASCSLFTDPLFSLQRSQSLRITMKTVGDFLLQWQEGGSGKGKNI